MPVDGLRLLSVDGGGVRGRESPRYNIDFSLRGVPVSENFIDRPLDSAALEQYLLPRLGHQQRKVFVLHGLGGIGKTQIAVNFARRYHAHFSCVLWLDGTSEERVKQSIADCARRLPEPDRTAIRRGIAEADGRVQQVLEWLQRPDNCDWLLIFDNVDQDYEQGGRTCTYRLHDYFPGDQGSILITTRLSTLGQLGEHRLVSEVDLDLARSIFRKWYRKDLVSDPEELLDLLKGLPLALAQAASYIREVGVSIDEYIEMYKQEWEDLMDYANSTPPLLDYPEKSVASTWRISFKAIQKRNTAAAKLLQLWAFYENRNMSYAIFQDTTDHIISRWFNSGEDQERPGWLTDVLDVAKGKTKFLSAAKLLLDYSMIEMQEQVGATYAIHPVVHRWALYIQTPCQRREFLLSALIIAGARNIRPLEYATPEQWNEHPYLFAHVDRCWAQLLKENDIVNCREWQAVNFVIVPELRSLGYLFVNQNRSQEAEQIFLLALEGSKASKELGPNHPCTLSLTSDLANLYRSTGRLQDAETNYVKLLESIEGSDLHVLGYRFVLDTFSHIASFFRQMKRLDEAEKLYVKILGVPGPIGDWRSASTLATARNLADVYRDQGKLKQAEEIYHRVLDGTGRTLSTEDLLAFFSVADELLKLKISQKKIDSKQVGEILQLTLEAREITYGGNHPLTLEAFETSALFYFQSGDLRRSYVFAQRAMREQLRVLGPNTSRTYKMEVLLWAMKTRASRYPGINLDSLEIRVQGQ